MTAPGLHPGTNRVQIKPGFVVASGGSVDTEGVPNAEVPWFALEVHI